MIHSLLKLRDEKNGIDLDSPAAAMLHAEIINKKHLLKSLYKDFYMEFSRRSSSLKAGLLLELGSGGGILKSVIPEAITSDMQFLPNIDICLSAEEIPFKNSSLDAFLMLDVLHHIKNPINLFNELNRCLRQGGKVIMIEPANTLWGSFIYKHFHHEDFDRYRDWGLSEKGGPLSLANGAIPWIIFVRDRKKFMREYPELKIKCINFHTPLRYLVSGGLSMKQLLPGFTYHLVKGIESILSPFNRFIGMFMTIELEKDV